MVHRRGEEHDEKLRRLLNRLQNKGRTFRVGKGEFGTAEMTWFGCIYDKDGMRDNRIVRCSGV